MNDLGRRAGVLAMAWIATLAATGSARAAQPAGTLKIGVTLHSYYWWTKNVVGDLPGYEVRPAIRGSSFSLRTTRRRRSVRCAARASTRTGSSSAKRRFRRRSSSCFMTRLA